MTENEIAKEVVDAAYKIHSEIGPGLLESAYELLLSDELEQRGFQVARQKSVSITFNGREIDEAYRMDLVVNEKLVVELKSVEELRPVHKKQLLTYLRLSGLKLGLLINFGEYLIKNGISRVVNGL